MAKKSGLMRVRQGERCAALDDHGRQCRNLAVAVERYHGDQELYGYLSLRRLVWVRVATCQKHRDK